MGKRYYWLKLHNDFFTDKRIKKLRKIAGGDTYTVIYLKMMLKSVNNDGVLEYDGIEGTFAEELALDLDEDADNVQVTINYLIQTGLLEDLGNGEYSLSEVKNLVGSESASAQRVREYRKRQDALQCNTDVTEVKRIGNAEKEEEKREEEDTREDKTKENKTKAKKERKKKEEPPRHRYGEYGNVLLSDRQYERLIAKYGEGLAKACIDYLDIYCQSSGRTYKDYSAAIGQWVADKMKKEGRMNGKGERYAERNENTSTEQGAGATVSDDPFEGLSDKQKQAYREMCIEQYGYDPFEKL